MTSHVFVVHSPKCTDLFDGEHRCMICHGGLLVCRVCGLSSNGLTTDCPGKQVDGVTAAMARLEKLDFKDGQWVSGPIWGRGKLL